MIAQALELLEREGREALGLRAVARATGVSGAAPYSHFADKAALLAAVAEVGFRQLTRKLEAAGAEAGAGGAFKALARAYVAFALAHPPLYRLMFGPPFAAPDAHPGLSEASRACFTVLEDAVRIRIGRADAARGQATAMGAWALVHGLAMLILDRKAFRGPPNRESETALVDSVVGVFSAGLERG